jgi:hypothetical protein
MSNDQNDHQGVRMIVALAAEADDKFIWDRLKVLQPEMFAAGPVAIKFGYYGEEGALPTRPFITTHWATDADDLAELMEKGRAQCVCGCFVEVGDILEQALRETQQALVQAVVIVGDRFHGDLDAAIATARQLRAVGTRLFLFQQGRSSPSERAFKILAEVTDGAHFQFNPHIERIAERLPEMFEAVAHFAVGGMAALQARDNESAALLLEQMNAASQIAQDTQQKV